MHARPKDFDPCDCAVQAIVISFWAFHVDFEIPDHHLATLTLVSLFKCEQVLPLVTLQWAELGWERAQKRPLVILWRKVNAAIKAYLAQLRRKILTITHQNGIDLHIVR